MEDLQNTTRKNKAIFLVTALMPWLKLSILPELNTVLLNLELLVCVTACCISHTLLDFSLPLLFFFFFFSALQTPARVMYLFSVGHKD